MTEEQLKIAANFEARVRQLMFLCNSLKQENEKLKSRLAAQQTSNDLLTEENKKLNTKYNTLMMARIISVKQDDLKGAKNKLSKLVREVDECIKVLLKE
jgi:septal ring factor EnvC (AmiA/AmiB activator)